MSRGAVFPGQRILLEWGHLIFQDTHEFSHRNLISQLSFALLCVALRLWVLLPGTEQSNRASKTHISAPFCLARLVSCPLEPGTEEQSHHRERIYLWGHILERKSSNIVLTPTLFPISIIKPRMAGEWEALSAPRNKCLMATSLNDFSVHRN